MPTVQSIANSIRDLFSDTSVPQVKTRKRLEELQDLIEGLLESLDVDESSDGLEDDDDEDADDLDDDDLDDDLDTRSRDYPTG